MAHEVHYRPLLMDLVFVLDQQFGFAKDELEIGMKNEKVKKEHRQMHEQEMIDFLQKHGLGTDFVRVHEQEIGQDDWILELVSGKTGEEVIEIQGNDPEIAYCGKD